MALDLFSLISGFSVFCLPSCKMEDSNKILKVSQELYLTTFSRSFSLPVIKKVGDTFSLFSFEGLDCQHPPLLSQRKTFLIGG